MTSPGERLLRRLPFESGKRSGEGSTISLAIKIRLFNTTCVTVLLYGCESWLLSVNMQNKINAFATSCYRIMLNIKRLDRVSNARIHEMTNTQPLINTVRQRQLQSSNIVDFNHHQAEGDANLLICQTVVDSASQCTILMTTQIFLCFFVSIPTPSTCT